MVDTPSGNRDDDGDEDARLRPGNLLWCPGLLWPGAGGRNLHLYVCMKDCLFLTLQLDTDNSCLRVTSYPGQLLESG